jgi:ArsR family transcriptional regulator, arsenate/arsenite/antimonite-responsive transcriptional repressor
MARLRSVPKTTLSIGITEEDAFRLYLKIDAISCHQRIRIIALLREHVDILAVYDIASIMDLSQPTISSHLRILRECGIVSKRMVGVVSYYYIIPGMVEKITSEIQERMGTRQ